ncbi:keratin-associated protein 9-1-like [Sitophilus oryzae]|uniref:Keratin-associated protein 9-1-like n=1 Tax=Sitophilus oryzae TaxID=7048 RepID=A0A6J2XU24_SITOR|nr:keratin-associated protein 9-1-like [Sitophilus oryzae]
MACARCGSGIYKTEEFISLNKVWHKHCFSCYQCAKHLDKDKAKVFQGELFCEFCYNSVIKKLFEVLSQSSICRPCKVVSSPSCVPNNNCVKKNNCEEDCNKLYCFEKIQTKPIRSCSCIPSKREEKNEYCFLFPLPREVANYYNRAHMKKQKCLKSSCCPPPERCSSCCKKPCCCPIQIRTLPPNPCCCRSCSPPPCKPCSPPLCKSCPPTTCRCCCPREICPSSESSNCCCPSPDPCCAPKRCPTPCRRRPCSPRPRLPPRPVCRPPSPPQPPSCCCEKCQPRCCRTCEPPCCPKPKYCTCGTPRPCNCKMSQVRAQCTAYCVRCCQKVYAAEKIQASCGAYHSSCFTCSCCNKCLDVKNFYEGCGEIYCKQCYNHFFGIKCYGFGRLSC